MLSYITSNYVTHLGGDFSTFFCLLFRVVLINFYAHMNLNHEMAKAGADIEKR